MSLIINSNYYLVELLIMEGEVWAQLVSTTDALSDPIPIIEKSFTIGRGRGMLEFPFRFIALTLKANIKI